MLPGISLLSYYEKPGGFFKQDAKVLVGKIQQGRGIAPAGYSSFNFAGDHVPG